MGEMSRLLPGKFIQVINGRWYHCKKKEIQECCNCGFSHVVIMKIKDGMIYSKWNVLNKNGDSHGRNN